MSVFGKFRAFALACVSSLLSLHCYGSTAWLQAQQQSDGSFASPQDLALPIQSTAEAVTTLRLLGVPNVGLAPAYISSDTYDGTEYLARKILVQADNPAATAPLIAQLLTHQNADGGFGERVGYQSSALDTAFALDALIGAGRSDTPAGSSAMFLLQSQSNDGSWSVASQSDVYTTALCVRALSPLKDRLGSASAAIAAANNFILSRRGADGLWGEDFLSAQALLTLATTSVDIAPVQQSVDAFKAHRLADTSWAEDVYTTALALRATFVLDARRAGATVPASGGAVSGNVFRAGTSEPIADVDVAAVSGAQARTNSEGYFVLSGLPAGDQTLTLQKSGYASASKVVLVRSGQIDSAGSIYLAQSSNEALVRGQTIDALSGETLDGVTISLSGPASRTVVSDGNGEFEFTALPPGQYAISFSRSGYYTVNGSVDAPPQSALSIRQGITREGAALDTNPIDVSGRVVDAASHAAVVGAQLSMDGAVTVVSGSDGLFTFGAVTRGNHSVAISKSGFAAATFSFVLPAGANGSLGDLALSAATATQASTSLTVYGKVVDGLDNHALAGATITVVQTGASATADAQGNFILKDLALLAFDVAVSATGHQTGTFGLTASGYGDVSGTFTLAPDGGDPQATSSTLRGVVRDSATSAPLSGAVLRVVGTSASAVSNDAGLFEITGITLKDFDLSAALAGYSERGYHLTLSQHGTYALDIGLTQEAGAAQDQFDVVSVVAEQGTSGAHADARFTARIANLTDQSQTVSLIADVINSAGLRVARASVSPAGTNVPTTSFNFAAHAVSDFAISWNTAQFSPGPYRIRMNVVQDGSITRDTPQGIVLAQAETVASVNSSRSIDGALALDPPLAQAGSTQSIHLTAVISNSGNEALTDEPVTLAVLDRNGQTIVHQSQASLVSLGVGNVATVDFGTWIPNQTGDLPILVTATNSSVSGAIHGVLYVGDRASGTFTVDRQTVPLGTQTVHADISLSGVDVRTGTSTDPLFFAVREAIRKGSLYVAPAAMQWKQTQNPQCLGCHIQTQSLIGLNEAAMKGSIDPAAASAVPFLFNDIVGSQQASGSLHMSHDPYFNVMQSALGIWSLSYLPDEKKTFRTLYKASTYLRSQMRTSGNQSWWDYAGCGDCEGWWSHVEAMNMSVVKGYAGLLDMAQKAGNTPFDDFVVEDYQNIGIRNVMDTAEGSDGALWFVDYSGVLYARDLNTQVTRTVATGLPTPAYGVAVAADGTAYVSSRGSVTRIDPNGSKTTLVSGSQFGYLTDIEVGADGFLYVVDHSNNEIWKVSVSGTATVLASGGILTGPHGLLANADGSLLVTTNGAGNFRIVSVASNGATSIYADGFTYPLDWIRRAADGALYLSTAQYGSYDYTTPPGVFRLDSDRLVQRISTFNAPGQDGFNALAVIGGVPYIHNASNNHLYRIRTQALDTSQLASIKAALPNIARYSLARYGDNTGINLIQAWRLILLSEIRGYSDDAALNSQIDTAVSTIAATLKSRQRADGGWIDGIGGTKSDPTVTSFIGIALEYTHPSVNDPVIRNTITYLLNSQNADGSWPSNSYIFHRSLLGPASFVMAYLPTALERLGGIDTDLHLTLPATVALSHPSITPTSQSTDVNGEIAYTWSLQGVTAKPRDLQFDLTLNNLVYQEQRPVATSAYLEFANSFTNEHIQSALEVPSVKAVSSLGLALSTAQSTYGANSDAAITSSITNVGAAPMDGSVHLTVAASDGAPVADLGTTPFAAVSVGGTLTVPTTWNTGTMLAGSYQVHGTLLDKSGNVVDEANTVFSIVTPSATISASLVTDKPVYQAWDTGSITARIRNLALNAVQPPAIAEVSVTRPNATVLFTSTYNVPTLAMGSLSDRAIALNLSDAAAGTYHVQLTVRDEFTHAVTAIASTTFDVQRDDLQALRGNVAVQSSLVDAGTSNICTDTIMNVAHTALSGAVIAQSLVSLDSGAVIQTTQQTLNFNGGQPQILLRNVATAALPQGAYACVLTATYQGRTQQLGAAGFQVTAPPIRIDTQVSVGNHGRVLVLVDAPASATDASDPFSGSTVPDLNVQLAHIKSVLNEAGWSYTIVQSATDFDREFHTGGYEVYAIFSEVVKLAVSLQDEVVSAVHNGAGLIVAGNHDRRNSKLETALGIQSLGKNLSVSSLVISASDVMSAGEDAIRVNADVLEMKLEGATAFGRYRLTDPKNNVETAAATKYAYGEGKSVYVGFDLIMAGAASGDDSLFAQVFTHALSYVHPEVITPIANHVLPLQIALTNQGVATSGRILLKLPTGVTAIDRGSATVLSDGTLAWTYSLSANQTLALPTLYVKLASQPGDVNFRFQIQTGAAPNFVDYGEKTLTVRVSTQ